ncbi:MAG: hypothetical protein U5N85_10820 [Arcicella sp.]|nr:hypothetical protein [Arcicella sp.]
MPRVEFEITKAGSIEVESIRFANTFINPDGDSKLIITSTSLKTESAVDCPTTNPKLKVNIRTNGIEGLKWTFSLTINGKKITNPDPLEIFIDEDGRGDLRKEF